MPGNRITLELGGLPTEDGYIQLADFLGALQQFKSALSQADLAATHGRSSKLRIVELSLSSPARVGIEVIPLNPTEDYSSEIAETFFAASRKQIDPTRSEANRALLNAVTNIASMVGKSVAQVTFKNGTEQVTLTPALRLEIEQILPQEHFTKGTVRGRLEFINLHGGANKFRIYPLVGPRKVICRFRPENLDKAIGAVNKPVAVMGLLQYRRGEYFPRAIDVIDIQPLPPDSELPALSQLRGIAPDATDGMKSEDFVRKLRDAWQD